ncbi:uncharacterized protein LOC107263024 [Cephus cinctus]|uniref:Uncharacterized protein LOC107263024 n=1 Tax=Cephus cinctus TaxID=211228 RepID=A0AAJ7BGB7_CEPCN|nr:uncharacterized protein LOC107263024 [Cephus cinctus]
MHRLLILRVLLGSAILLATTSAVPTPSNQEQHPSSEVDCLEHEKNLLSCIAVKAVGVLKRAARSSDIRLLDGISFVRDGPMERTAKAHSPIKSEAELMNELPRDATDRTIKLASMLYESAVSFLKSHTLRISMPEGGQDSIARSFVEGRGKIKKMILPLVAAAGVKIFALVPILLGGLALLALKALFVGKIALLLAGILAFQKLFGGSNGAGISSASNFFSKTAQPASTWIEPAAASPGWASGSSNAGQSQGYYRSFDAAGELKDAHELAYSGQTPDVLATAANQAH